MLKPLFQIAAFGLILGAFAPEARPQDAELPNPFTIQGDWWCRDTGSRTVLRLNVGPIGAGVAPLTGGGVSRDFESAFALETDGESSQELQFDSNRVFSGTLALQDVGRNFEIGELEIQSGKLNSTKTRMKIRARLQIGEGSPKNLRLICSRLPTSGRPDWEGRSTDGRLRGTGVKSDKFDIQLTESSDLGFPFFDLLSGGPVRIDGNEVHGVYVVGVVGVTDRGKVAAELMSGTFGHGVASGRISMPTVEGERPTLKLKGSTDLRPRLRTKSTLLELSGLTNND